MSDRIETVILRNLIFNEDFTRKVIPYLKSEYFRQSHEKAIFESMTEFISKYNKNPTPEVIQITLEQSSTVTEETYKEIVETLDEITSGSKNKLDPTWLIDQTEEFCKKKALANAAYKTVSILEGKEKQITEGSIPELFEDALSVNFDPSVGHDYVEDAEQRFDILHSEESKLPFDIDILNQVTKGGVKTNGTLNVIAGPVYGGKTLILSHLAGCYLKQKKNVLYITLEIDKENIGYRIDCSLLNVSTDEIDSLPKETFLKRVEKIKSAPTTGKLIIQDYPAHSVHVNNFRALVHELALKLEFKPDVVIIDYLNLCASSRIKPSDKTHITIQAVAEELRGFAQELHLPLWTATQLDAEGMESSDPKMTNVSGSKVGLIATCDLMWMIVISEKMRELGQIMIKQQKNRYKDASDHKKFYIGMDRKKMRLYNVEQKGQIPKNDDSEEENMEDIKQKVSKKYGTEAYQSAYKFTKNAKEFGPRPDDSKKSKFADFVV